MSKVDVVVEVIAEYLQSNRRLVVPAFGAFMVKESGEYLFSNLLNADDGVLALLLRGRGLTEMEAAIVIDRFIFEIRNELEQYGYYRLDRIGTLRLEPDTKAIRLYPLVNGELPKQVPYVPKQDPKAENGKQETENESKSNVDKTEIPTTHNTVKKPVKSRKKFDLVMVVAVLILLVALVAIGYGWYVSTLGMADDDAAMDALRIVPEQIVK